MIRPMQLPGADQAVIDDAKVRDYLLATNHPVGQFKARFFANLGYDAMRWSLLVDDLLKHARDNDVVKTEPSEYGMKYLVAGELRGPNGQSSPILVAWMIRKGENVPRLVTAFPDRRRR